MTGDPVRVGERLAEARQQIADKRPRVVDVSDPDEVERVKGEARQLAARQRWDELAPRRFHRAQLDDLAGDVADELAAWLDAGPRQNLVLLGPVGTGKTHAAFAVCRWLLYEQRASTVAFRPVGELLEELRPGDGSEAALRRLLAVDVLVVDDLGTERATEWTAERVHMVLNRRWLEELPTIVTTNLPGSRRSTPEGYEGPVLDEVLGERTFSRLVDGAVVVRLSGKDRRRG